MKNIVRIKEFELSKDSPVFILLEAGANHNGDIEQAIKMIDIAVDAGANGIKFQHFTAEKNLSKGVKFYPNVGENPLLKLKKLELSIEKLKILRDYAYDKNIQFSSSFSHIDNFRNIVKLGVDFIKVSSFFIDAIPVLEEVAEAQLPTFLSTGTATVKEIENAIEIFERKKNDKLIILHCVSIYPTPNDLANLLMIKTLINSFPNYIIGYSDHTENLVAPSLSVALGAKVIEKHFTFSKWMEGPDHKFAIEPHQVKNMIKDIRLAEKLLGSGKKEISLQEKETKLIARRSIFLNKNIKKGKTLALNDITLLRPGTGIPPTELSKIIGKMVVNDLNEGTMLKWEDIH